MFEERLAGYEPDIRGRTTSFAGYLEPGRDSPYALWANPGEPVRLSLFLINVLNSLDDQRAYISMLVDYHPVEAHYVRWIDDRGGRSEEWDQTGVAFDIESAGELVDIEIEPSEFPQQRAYELSLLVTMGRSGYKYSFGLNRFALFNGGYKWPASPCFEAPMVGEPDAREAKFVNNIAMAYQDALVLVPGVEDPRALHDPVHVAAGSTVDLDVALENMSTDVVRPAAAVGFLEGQPVAGPWLYHVSPDDDAESPNTIAWRTTLALKLPTAPGVYDFQIGMWEDPMIPAQDPDRRPYLQDGRRVVHKGITGNGVSNLVRFIVD